MAKVWVVLQLREGGQLPRISWEALGAGQKLAQALGGKAEAVVLGSGVGLAAAEVAKNDLAAVYVAGRQQRSQRRHWPKVAVTHRAIHQNQRLSRACLVVSDWRSIF